IDTLIEYNQIRHHNITCVFDGWKSSFGQSSTIIGGIDVIYTGPGDKADDLIKRIIKAKDKVWTVISSDREIVNSTWIYDSISITSSQFEQRLFQALSNQGKTDNDFDDDEEDDFQRYNQNKGNPKMLSKKERLIRKTIEKL
ncbi:MAG: NYN domain-containing protein, partial [Nitrospirae bacterium]|nr:NYN domain-containing protein [Nitrospirota bacterium]